MLELADSYFDSNVVTCILRTGAVDFTAPLRSAQAAACLLWMLAGIQRDVATRSCAPAGSGSVCPVLIPRAQAGRTHALAWRLQHGSATRGPGARRVLASWLPTFRRSSVRGVVGAIGLGKSNCCCLQHRRFGFLRSRLMVRFSIRPAVSLGVTRCPLTRSLAFVWGHPRGWTVWIQWV
jgi:hypothetical protein